MTGRNDDFEKPDFPRFETARLRLRGLRRGDEEFLASLDSDPRVMEHIHNGALTQEEAVRFAHLQVETAGWRWHWGKWLVELRADGAPLGWVELGKLSGPDRDDLQVGYEFAPAHWGQGYAREAVARILQYAFEELRLERIGAIARPVNAASVRLLERFGFQLAGQRMDDGRVWCNLYWLTQQ